MEAASKDIKVQIVEAPMNERLALLHALAELALVPGKPYSVAVYLLSFLEEFVEDLDVLAEKETIGDRADTLRAVFIAFHTAAINAERLRLLYEHIEHDFPRFEAAGALLPMPTAVRLCHTMLSTGLVSAPAVVVLLRSALREPLMHFTDTAVEMRLLKMIEMLLRVDFLVVQQQLPPDVVEYLSVVRSVRYYDRDLRRDTALSYQLAFFLRKHGFPSERHMLGPYVLKVCDPAERVSFEPLEASGAWREGFETPSDRKKRHLEAIGWRSIDVRAKDWDDLGNHDAKASFIRKLLKENQLLDL